LLNAESTGYSPRASERLRTVFDVREADLDRPSLLQALGDVEVLVVRLRHRIDEELLAMAPRLRAVATATTGLDHVDLEACARRRGELVALRGEAAVLRQITATAELCWGLVLAVLRRIPDADRHVREGGWDRDRFRGASLHGRTLGIVGLG